MFNAIFIISIAITLLVIAFYLKYYKKLQFFKDDTDIIGILSNVAIILTLIYAIFSYTHTIYPVFEKEQQLKNAEQKVLDLNKLLETERNTRQFVENKLDTRIQIYENLSNEYTVLQHEKFNLENQLRDLKNKSETNKERAVYYLVLKEMHTIAYDDIYGYNKKNLQIETLNIAKKLNNGNKESIEYKASLIIKKFAEEKLTNNSTYKEIFEIYTYFYEVYDDSRRY